MASETRAEERRQFVRLGLRFNASYKVVASGESHPSFTRNVSGGGISFFTEKKLEPGTTVALEVRLPRRERPVRFTAMVIWSGALILSEGDRRPHLYEAGAKFVEISPQDLELILKPGTLSPAPAKRP